MWRCTTKRCRKELALRSGTYFEGSNIAMEQIIRILHLHVVDEDTSWKNDVGSRIDRYNCIRDVCIQYFLDHSSMIGGPGVEVKIDESKFGKRKYNRGRQVEGHWVFGGVERVTGECFMVEVARRDAATLIPIIQQYIRPGSIIHSDQWAAYNQITAATGMAHMTVNHSFNFVDPATGVHTQGVESMWSCCKRLMIEERTMHSQLFETYLPEFMWRRRFGGPEAFSNILKHIAEQYPV
ncbi:hypothetical protein EMCRGX_G017798 [Ephydatia muelleri]